MFIHVEPSTKEFREVIGTEYSWNLSLATLAPSLLLSRPGFVLVDVGVCANNVEA